MFLIYYPFRLKVCCKILSIFSKQKNLAMYKDKHKFSHTYLLQPVSLLKGLAITI